MRSRAAVLVALLFSVPAAGASIFVGNDIAAPRLAVDAAGTAQVTWKQAGAPQSVIVPMKGQLSRGGSLSGRDVSRPAPSVRLPLAVIVRRGPGGMLYGLQRWQVQPGGPVELHLARWSGAPPVLRLAAEGGRLTGSAAFQGRPVSGVTSTLEGKRLRIYVYLDCLGCPGATGWSRMIGVAPKADGTFAVFLRPSWVGRRYRATVAGPNVGATFAPDARAESAAPYWLSSTSGGSARVVARRWSRPAAAPSAAPADTSPMRTRRLPRVRSARTIRGASC
jgi:hypothetical protein